MIPQIHSSVCRWFLFNVLLISATCAHAGGPIAVTGRGFTIPDGLFVTWDISAGPIQYRTPGAGNLGALSHDDAVALVQKLFQVWEDVPTASIRYQRAGDILPSGGYTGGAVTTVQQFNDVVGSCSNGINGNKSNRQSPIVFDADGSLFAALGYSKSLIGFAGPCVVSTTGHFVSGLAALNGKWIDGNSANGELTQAQFNEAFVHEFGHFSGLEHSQINVEVLNQTLDNCDPVDVAGLPIMFPFAYCQARVDANNIPILAPDDVAWISRLYPETVNNPPSQIPFATQYTSISGNVFFSDGISQVQGVNVIAHDTSDPSGKRKVFSVVTGYLFTDFPGQNVSPHNPASPYGAMNLALRGYFEIALPAGSYALEFQSVDPRFKGGSSVGPLSPPVPMPGTASSPPAITVNIGSKSTGNNVILQGTLPTFDSYEAP